jgi:hypothetical protein
MKTKQQLQEEIDLLTSQLESLKLSNERVSNIITENTVTSALLFSIESRVKQLPKVGNSILWVITNRKLIVEILIFILDTIEKFKSFKFKPSKDETETFS